MTPPRSFHLAISPAFTCAQTLAVRVAAAQWLQALPGLSLDETVATCPVSDDETLCIAPAAVPPADPAIIGVTFRRPGSSATSYLVLDRIAADGAEPELVALHELGHALGLDHHPAGTAMAPLYPQQATAPTADDVAQWETR